MTGTRGALWSETLKARRTKVLPLTAAGFAMLPLMAGFFMFLKKNSKLAHRLGLAGAKAGMLDIKADWPGFMKIIVQGMSAIGILLFTIIIAWVFGREFSDRTGKDLLALPTSRSSIVLAKFVVGLVWMSAVTVMVLVLGFAIGAASHLPGWSASVALRWSWMMVATSLMTIAVISPAALVASAGKGYLAPVGFAILVLVLAQVFSATGWGPFFPWAIPGLYTGAGGEVNLGLANYMIVVLTSGVGIAATFAYWRFADQTR